MRLIISVIAMSIAACASVETPPPKATQPTAAEAPAASPAPQWVIDDIDHMTRNGGTWRASNTAYQSENEPMSEYVMVWTKGLSDTTMTGRLYGVVDGEATGDFWRFRQYWHPGKASVVLEQFGAGGAVGVGYVTPSGDGFEMTQTFYHPDLPVSETGHRNRHEDDNTHITESFTIVDGEWQTSRIYSWKRQSE